MGRKDKMEPSARRALVQRGITEIKRVARAGAGGRVGAGDLERFSRVVVVVYSIVHFTLHYTFT